MGHYTESYDTDTSSSTYVYRESFCRRLFPCSLKCFKIRCNWFTCGLVSVACFVCCLLLVLLILFILGGFTIYTIDHPCHLVECENGLCIPLYDTNFCDSVTCFGSDCVNEPYASPSSTPSLSSSITPSLSLSRTPSISVLMKVSNSISMTSSLYPSPSVTNSILTTPSQLISSNIISPTYSPF